MNKICPVCDVKLEETDRLRIVGNDRPYFNLGFHYTCYQSVDIDKFIPENIKKITELCNVRFIQSR